MARASRWERGVAQMQAGGFADTNASIATSTASGGMATSSGFGSSNVVAEARRYLGGNPTGRGRLWCARFMNMVLERTGLHGTGSDLARSFASYGQRVSGPQIGAIAVMGRRGGGHVGVVSGIDAGGNPIVVSGNNGQPGQGNASFARADLRLRHADELMVTASPAAIVPSAITSA
jgi:uncharacterized protein (TIGR02594 family)